MILKPSSSIVEKVGPYQNEIILGVRGGIISDKTFINYEETVLSYYHREVSDLFDNFWTMRRKRVKRGPINICNNLRAFPLLNWFSQSDLISFLVGQDSIERICHIVDMGANPAYKTYLNKKDLQSNFQGLELQDLDHHLGLFAASIVVWTYLNILDKFHAYKAPLLNAWLSQIDIDIYGKPQNSKSIAQVEKITKKGIGISIEWAILLIEESLKVSNASSRNDGREFEGICRDILTTLNWQVLTTAISGDFGGDLIASKDGLRWCIQCKDTVTPAGVQAIQQASAAMTYYVCDHAAVVSRSGYTEQAFLLAARIGVQLFNEYSLATLGSLRRPNL